MGRDFLTVLNKHRAQFSQEELRSVEAVFADGGQRWLHLLWIVGDAGRSPVAIGDLVELVGAAPDAIGSLAADLQRAALVELDTTLVSAERWDIATIALTELGQRLFEHVLQDVDW